MNLFVWFKNIITIKYRVLPLIEVYGIAKSSQQVKCMSTVHLDYVTLKGIVHPKMKILSSTHQSCSKRLFEDILKNVGKQLTIAIDLHGIMSLLSAFFKNILQNSYRFGTT